MKLRLLHVLAMACSACAVGRAAVSLPAVFGDHMVLQRDQPVLVWGHASPGEAVSVRFGNREKRTEADTNGAWRVSLPSFKASPEPRDLVVAGQNVVTFHDVVVGEVWLCAGQSNMEMALGVRAAGADPESSHDPALARQLGDMSYPTLRLFKVSQKSREAGDLRSERGWSKSSGPALAEFSAVGFFFGRKIQDELKVPVGLIQSAWGGSRLEEWISDQAYAPLESILGRDVTRCFERDPAIVSRDYDSMIAPLAPFSLRGVLWYQGESNILFYQDGVRYADKFAALVANWRAIWSAPTLPFYSVQLAPFIYTQFRKGIQSDDELPRLWEAQGLATAIPHTGLVPIGDTVEDLHAIHPGHKSVVGHRLAALALAKTYGKKGVTVTGPLFRRAIFEGATAIVEFDGVDGGLMTTDGAAPAGFELAGDDGKFIPAAAAIRGRTVEITAPGVPHPTAVRYCWHESSRPNLANRAGWPAYAFRSNGPSWTVSKITP